MARKILNRKDLRADYDASERRKDDEELDEDEDVDDEDEDEESEDDDAEEDEDEEGEGDEDEDEEKPKKKKKKKVVAKPVKKPRTRTAKVVRMRLVWGVFSNNHQCVATYEYPKKSEAEQHAARLAAEKRSTFFVQPVKEPIEEKKEK